MPQHLLATAAYTDPAWFARERQMLFGTAWMLAGTVNDFGNTGDYVTLNVAGHSLAVLQDGEGQLRGFHNICRHRGTELLESKGNAGKVLVCPYHRWSYGLDGSLRGVPDKTECFPDLDRSGLGLHQASVGVWNGLVFVNPSPGQDFDAWIAPLAAHGFPHDVTDAGLKVGPEFLYKIRCNWKVFFENAIDGYHLAYLHENTLGGPRAALNAWAVHGQSMVWYSTERDGIRNRIPKFVEDQAKGSGATKIKGAEDPGYGGVYMLFPLTIITPSPWSLTVSSLEPVDAETTLLRARTWVPDSWWAAKEKLEEAPGYSAETGLIESRNWTTHPLKTGDFQTEDIWVCEKVQRSMQSPKFSVGPMAQGSGGEAMLEVFQRWVLDHVG